MAKIATKPTLLQLAANRFPTETDCKKARRQWQEHTAPPPQGRIAKFLGWARGLDKFSRAEQNLFAATEKGEDADCTGLAGKDRIIRGHLLSWLCKDLDASACVTRSGGISIVGAIIDGEVSLDSVKIEFPLKASRCDFTGTILLEGAHIVSLALVDSLITYLSAESLVVEQIVDLKGSVVNGFVNLNRATIRRDLRCDSGLIMGDGTQQQALEFIGAAIQGTVYLDRFIVNGGVALTGAKIGGDLLSRSGMFISRERLPACNASRAKIEGSVLLRDRFEAEGKVLFWGASIGGDLKCQKAFFSAKGPVEALDFSRATIEGSVFLNDDFKAQGEVVLRGATIGGTLCCDNGQFRSENPGAAVGAAGAGSIEERKERTALDAASASIGSVSFRNMIAEGIVDFRSAYVRSNFDWIDVESPDKVVLDLQKAKVGTLLNHPNSWPAKGNLFLFGLTYDDIDEKASLDKTASSDRKASLDNQLRWIRQESPDSSRDLFSPLRWIRHESLDSRRDLFSPQPYEQLAAFLRTKRREEDAVKVMIAQNKDHGGHTKTLHEWLWYNFIGKAIGYGYRRGRPFLISLIVIIIGWLVFRAGYDNQLITPTDEKAYVLDKDGKRQPPEFYPKFNPFVYSVETFVPLVKLGMSDRWNAMKRKPRKF